MKTNALLEAADNLLRKLPGPMSLSWPVAPARREIEALREAVDAERARAMVRDSGQPMSNDADQGGWVWA